MAKEIGANIQVAALSTIGLPNLNEATIFCDSENALALTIVKNSAGTKVVKVITET